MLKSELLIKKFWSGNIRHDELKELEKLLEQQSENSASALLEQDTEEVHVTGTLDRKRADELLLKIHTNISATSHASKKKTIGYLPRIAGIAAGIALAVIITWQWVKKAETGQTNNTMPVIAIVHQHTVNKSDTVMNIALPDGSTAALYPHSSLHYDIPFTHNKRDITMSGAAEFNVSTDHAKPFTVYANGIATTALGTRFRVNTSNKNVQVLLYEGRVVIHPAINGGTKKAYLNPGEQLSVAKDFDYLITRISPAVKAKKNLRKEAPASNADSINLNFRNTPLADVFDNLAKKFQLQIVYTNREKLQEIPFTGYFNANDSLENLLKMLCGMNNLQYELTDNELKIIYP
ncbi:FecR family protein [Chitinophaga arvensicola]|uniref:Ferric-dicitrate binding protein FerR, regulates iron transport through sigma-19 n=1 Tax=Chitinophaga arvensicola TaxID=29529 RepID=A0A1I0RH92_9BACT|nr:FecR family protein [Chitinophaga arvensicola]SEW40237.1 protein of unknown function [Chitinophaga arvensicola]